MVSKGWSRHSVTSDKTAAWESRVVSQQLVVSEQLSHRILIVHHDMQVDARDRHVRMPLGGPTRGRIRTAQRGQRWSRSWADDAVRGRWGQVGRVGVNRRRSSWRDGCGDGSS
jgi:hypothetical protein